MLQVTLDTFLIGIRDVKILQAFLCNYQIYDFLLLELNHLILRFRSGALIFQTLHTYILYLSVYFSLSIYIIYILYIYN